MKKILNNQDKDDFISFLNMQNISSSNRNYKSYCEVLAAQRIIQKIFGEKWCEKINKNLEDSSCNDLQLHPLDFYLTEKNPMKMMHLCHFGSILKSLYGKSNLEDKIQEFVKKQKYSAANTFSFNSLYTELKVANYFLKRGLNVTFLIEKKNKTPDLLIHSNDGSAYVECKRKNFDEKLLVDNITRSVEEASSQLEGKELPGVVYVDTPLSKSIKVISKFREFSFNELFLTFENIHYVVLGFQLDQKIGSMYGTQSFLYSYQNKTSEKKLSPSIEDLMKDIYPLELEKILDDTFWAL